MMNKVLLIAVLLGISVCSCGQSEELQQESDEYTDTKFEVGQIWNYETRDGEENSSLTIVKIESDTISGVIVHLYVDNLSMQNSTAPDGKSKFIQHLPMSREAVDKSVLSLKGSIEELPNYTEGYNEWKIAYDQGKAGIWSIPVNKTITAVESVLNPSQTE